MKTSQSGTPEFGELLRLARELCDAQTVVLDLAGNPGLWISSEANGSEYQKEKAGWADSANKGISFPIRTRGDENLGRLIVLGATNSNGKKNDHLSIIASQIASYAVLESTIKRQQRIVDHIPAMIAYWDSNLICRFANEIYFDWFGFNAEKILGMPMKDVLGPTTFELNRNYILGALKGETQHFERDLTRKKQGDVRHTQATYLPDIVDGIVQGFFVLVSDVTERKSAELQAIEASKIKSRFLAKMSHELRTPLNGVLGMLDLALSTPLNQDVQDYLRVANFSAEHLLAVIEDILDISKIEAGKLVLTEEPFSLRKVVGSAINALKVQSDRNGSTLNLTIEPSAPDALFGDPVRLRQVIFNLVGNAIKFTDKGSIEVNVKKAIDADDFLCFEVKDTGVGISKEMHALIFEPFSQVYGFPARKHGGTGLGLAISKEIVHMMNGEIGVTSELGQGSTFYFTSQLKVIAHEGSSNLKK